MKTFLLDVEKGNPARRVRLETRILQDDALAVKGEFVFMLPDVAGAKRILGRDLPPEWLKLCR